ncbi:integral membrane protein [Streptomyces griseoflavus Tu4000]|uniref:Integral membrane protein n=1 Tax=Streptomyces griseoflavus Tu4000 TaxID=467200 RepID=D9Y1M7_9ACTN|nr:integral membrane protein [Streptomyces griseoflavus Tu4000]
MISTAIRVARVGSAAELAAAALMMLGYPCLMLAALVPSIPAFAAAAAVTYLSDHYLHRRGSYLVSRLSKVRAGLSIRFLIRQLLLILLLARLSLADNLIYYGAIACFIAFYGLQAPHGALTTLIRNRRRMPVATRNIDLASRIRIPDAPPRVLLHRAAEKMLHLDLAAVAGILVGAALESAAVGYTGIGITVGLGLAYVLALVPFVRSGRIPPNAERVLGAVDDWLREYRPETVLYFSGSRDSAYQVNMWLETMEQLDTRPLVVLRERAILQNLAPTTVPVICVPGGVHLMNLDLSTVRVALYAANVGKNIHLLRVPTMKHVFIGHGDSDKLASVNPYSKVYDEVWTAGRAGRDRYAIADVGVRDDDIVEVGRPQLAPIETWKGVPGDRMPTVLYAPTWEGWDDNPGNTSILLAGENIVRKLVEAAPAVRVLYKPHPFTGTRSAQAKAAHQRIFFADREVRRRARRRPAVHRRRRRPGGREGRAGADRGPAGRAGRRHRQGRRGRDQPRRRDRRGPARGDRTAARRVEHRVLAFLPRLGAPRHHGRRAAPVRLLQRLRRDGLGHLQRGLRLHRQRQAVRRHGLRRTRRGGVQAAEHGGAGRGDPLERRGRAGRAARRGPRPGRRRAGR